jgi:polysaccharide biosynthesis protein PslH
LNILFLLQDVPFPVSDGMRWKVFHLLQYLSARHQCDVIAFSADALPDMEALKRELPRVHWLSVVPATSGVSRLIRAALALLSGRPASLGRFQSPVFTRVLREALARNKYDVVHYDIVNMVQYYVEGLPSVHSPNDATSLFYSRMAANAKHRLTRLRLKIGASLLGRYERRNYFKFTKIHVVSSVDASYLRSTVVGADVVCIPFGVAPFKGYLAVNQIASASRDNGLVLILGGANVPGVAAGIEEFVRLAIPEIAQRFPTVRFRIQGRGTEKLLHRIGISTSNIEASGWVDDLDDLIRSAVVVVLPDKSGTGIKTRALQALGCGATVVGTAVAFEGLREYVRSGEHCIIAESIPTLASEILLLLGDVEKRASLGREASRLAHDQLSWSRLGPQYEDLYRSAATSHYLIAHE